MMNDILHDKEMDDIHRMALDAFNDLVQLGMNVEVHAGAKLLETANQMLKTAMEAKDSKVDRKLKMIGLQLQKAKLDHSVSKNKDGFELEILLMKSQTRHSMNKYVQQDTLQMHGATT